MKINNLIRIITIPIVLFSLIGFFPVILNGIFLIRDRDLLINHKQYIKKYIFIDSIDFRDNEGGNTEWVYGYSKDLDNYKTTIYFNSIKDEEIGKELEMKNNGDVYKYIWYREGINKAYPAKFEDTKFPIKKYLYKMLKLPILWSLSIFISYIMIKISKKRKMFDKPKLKEK